MVRRIQLKSGAYIRAKPTAFTPSSGEATEKVPVSCIGLIFIHETTQ